jgi:hypothetical protein
VALQEAEIHLGFDIAEAQFDFPTLPIKLGQLLGRALKLVLQRGEQVKITWGGQVREESLHLSPNEYQQEQN